MDGSRSDNGSSLHIHKVDFLRWGHSLRQSSSDKSYFLSGYHSSLEASGSFMGKLSNADTMDPVWFQRDLLLHAKSVLQNFLC